MNQQKGSAAHKTVQIRLDDPSDVKILFCNHMEITHSPTEFTVTFAQAIPPSIKSEAEFINVEFVTARVLARFSMTPAMVKSVIKAFQGNLEKYEMLVKEVSSHARADADK